MAGTAHERLLQRGPSTLRSAAPRPTRVWAKTPRRPIGDGEVEDRSQSRAVRIVVDTDERLDPAVEVAMHHVRASDPDLIRSAVSEAIDPGVFEEASEDAANGDALAQALHAGPQRADAAHDEIDRDPGLRRLVQRVDDLLVDEAVELPGDPRGPAG